MLFSSITFLFYFLPLLIIIYYITPKKYKTVVLMVFSLLFYFLGEPKYILVLILSCIINYLLSKLIVKSGTGKKKMWLVISIFYNVCQLLIFKYTDFFIDNVNNIFKLNVPFMHLIMPIGISFYTFQILAYVIDVYKGKHEPTKNIVEFITYVSLFPQLIAGPIVRYSDIKNDLNNKDTSFNKFSEGVKRFIIGLSKKVLLANVLGEFSKKIIEETVLSAWIKPIAYTLQIYFDFSGYSDMAIGLGLMLGFRFLENFNYPLIASSITDFWRRWHMSLSMWFRDYVYIPLGGNRVGKLKWIRNILIVWFLTGFWHGASWNFIIWGVYFGILLIIEKLFLKKFLDKTKVFKYIYTSLIVIISFLIFSSENITDIIYNFKNMFFINDISFIGIESKYYLRSYLLVFIISIISATPLISILIKKLKTKSIRKVIDILEPIVYIILLSLCTAFLIDESFNPFLYFRF